ncbi:MAG: hypothetical protein CMQ11_06530 [Gammaproteobacteria bacterium]|nr:hypothetical protein [Gammaproteobacteria bacterium]
MPYLIVDNKKIADSELILDFLKDYTPSKLYARLSPEGKAVGLAFTRLAEDHLY